MIHGTNRPAGVGMEVTHGCMRIFPEDTDGLFHRVAPGKPVRIVNEQHKVDRSNGQLYVKLHRPLKATDCLVNEPDRTGLAR